MVGIVRRVDAEGDALNTFENVEAAQWIFKKNLGNLEVVLVTSKANVFFVVSAIISSYSMNSNVENQVQFSGSTRDCVQQRCVRVCQIISVFSSLFGITYKTNIIVFFKIKQSDTNGNLHFELSQSEHFCGVLSVLSAT